MKKVISLLLTLVLAFTLVVSLAACGAGEEEEPVKEEVTLVTTAVNGISIDKPSDLSDFAEMSGAMVAKTENASASIVVGPRLDAGGGVAAAYTEENYLATQATTYTEVEFVDFNNAAEVEGVPALVAHFKGLNSHNLAVEAYNIMFFFEDGTYQSVAVISATDVETSVAANLDAIIGSIKLG